MARYVQLKRLWTLGKRIRDPSGFGAVHEATADDGTAGVIKLIPKRPGADRELLFESLGDAPNVVPIIDSGETRTSWVLAMPRAERSLRAEITPARALTPVEAVPILIDIARALAAIEGKVVHRDLKPENVLLLDGRWSIADFGIARYAEASTAPETWKAAFSAPYAAPERWRFERATSATDVYSFGILAHELLSGSRPFHGDFDELREQHLHVDAPPISAVPGPLTSLIAECMFKAPQARPPAGNVVARLERALAPAQPGAARMQAANAAVRAAEAVEHAKASAAMSESERRDGLFVIAEASLARISERLREAVHANAPAVSTVRTDFDDWSLRLGPATIGMDPATRVKADPWGNWKPKFDVIAYASVGVLIAEDQYGYRGRVHSLWFCDATDPLVYRWFETGFMVAAMIPKTTQYVPFAFEPNESAGKALANALTEWQVAWPFTPIDQGEEEGFIERWLDWFGRAAQGELHRPSTLPERPAHDSWRRH